VMLRENDHLFLQRSDVVPNQPARWLQVQKAYRSAGLNLLNLLESGKRTEGDLYPAMYLCRHSVELELKAALGMAYVADHVDDLRGKLKEIFNTHDLTKLWHLFVSTKQLNQIEHLDENDELVPVKPLLSRMEVCIADLNAVDADSMAFRYPIDKQLRSSDFSGISIPNFVGVYIRMCRTLTALRMAVEALVRADCDPYSESERSLNWVDRFDNERWETEARLTTQAILKDASEPAER
jgi:hypothetical protein